MGYYFCNYLDNVNIYLQNCKKKSEINLTELPNDIEILCSLSEELLSKIAFLETENAKPPTGRRM